ncbi:MAG: MGMT family protein [Candidatus Diapherotrites archaeon]
MNSLTQRVMRYPATSFQKAVWIVLLRIPRGKVSTYGEIANLIGRPHAARAVGNACNANPFAPAVPCHRVVASNGSLGGYAYGLNKKSALLRREGILFVNNHVVDFDARRFVFPSRVRRLFKNSK